MTDKSKNVWYSVIGVAIGALVVFFSNKDNRDKVCGIFKKVK